MNPAYNQILSRGLASYRNPNRTRDDIVSTLYQYNSLSLHYENHVFNDGSQRMLLLLAGVIPVTYNGKDYNIPIKIWLLDTYPMNAPLCFVNPTAKMDIRPSKHVDQNGVIYLPYLHEWRPGFSDLPGLIGVLRIVFGEMPPVYSKPARASFPYGSTSSAQSPPYPTPQHLRNRTPYPPPNFARTYSMPGTECNATPYPTPVTGVHYNQGRRGYLPSPPGRPYAETQPVYSGQYQQSSAATLLDMQWRASVQSAVEDKMKRKLREMTEEIQAETDVLRKTETDLKKGRERLSGIMQRIEMEQVDIQKIINTLKEKNTELSHVIEKGKRKDEEVPLDDAVQPASPLYKQLVDAYAEENATQDGLYYLGEGLKMGTLNMETYLRHVRRLSRRQFQLRYQMIMCRKKAAIL